MYFRPAAQPPAERSSSKPGTVLAAEKRGASIFRRSAGVSEASVSIVVLPGALLTAVAGIVEPMAAANEALGRAAYKYRSLVSDDSGVQMGGGVSSSSSWGSAGWGLGAQSGPCVRGCGQGWAKHNEQKRREFHGDNSKQRASMLTRRRSACQAWALAT